MHCCRDILVFEKLRFQNVSVHTKTKKPALSNCSSLESVFEKLDKHSRWSEAASSNFPGAQYHSVKLCNVRKRFSVYLEMRVLILSTEIKMNAM